jgi:hypothetical protein
MFAVDSSQKLEHSPMQYSHQVVQAEGGKSAALNI